MYGHLCSSVFSKWDTVLYSAFFLNLAIDCELFPMDELLLKIDVPVEAARPGAGRFMTIFLFYKLGGGCLMATQIWETLHTHFLVGKLTAHISTLMAPRSSSIENLPDLDTISVSQTNLMLWNHLPL